jgi:hypothetical protein
MGIVDQSLKAAALAEPLFVVKNLGKLLGWNLTFRSWHNTQEIPLPAGPEREADLAVLCDCPEIEEAISVVLEFQAQINREKLKILLLEVTTFDVYVKDKELQKPIKHFGSLIYLTGECPQSEYNNVSPLNVGTQFQPAVWNIAHDSAEQTLSEIENNETTWGGLFWVPLMQGAHDAKLIQRWLSLVQHKVPKSEQAQVRNIALIFSALPKRYQEWSVIKQEENMWESPYVDEILGIGAVRAKREALTRFLRIRHPGILQQPGIELAINNQSSLELLDSWIDAAAAANTPDDFLAVIKSKKT